jgi:hypothetical protein
MGPNPRQPRRFRFRLRTLLVVIAFLALFLGALIQSVLLERQRRRGAVFVAQLAAEMDRARASLRKAEAVRSELQVQLAAQGKETDSGPKKPDSTAR